MLARNVAQKIVKASGLHQWWAVRHGSSIPLVRDPSYARVENGDLDFFRGLLGDTGVITDSTALQALNQYVPPSSFLENTIQTQSSISLEYKAKF